jgi:hypothetical protein
MKPRLAALSVLCFSISAASSSSLIWAPLAGLCGPRSFSVSLRCSISLLRRSLLARSSESLMRNSASSLRGGHPRSLRIIMSHMHLSVANFHEKALFVKPTWRLCRGRTQRSSALRAMLPSALPVSSHLSVARCIMRSVFSNCSRRCNLRIGLSCLRVDQVRNCAVTFRDPKRSSRKPWLMAALPPL